MTAQARRRAKIRKGLIIDALRGRTVGTDLYRPRLLMLAMFGR